MAMTITTQPNANTGSLSDISSNAEASTSAKSAKPLSRASKVAGPSSKPRSRAGNQQPTPADLKKFGIKVRDFAYESELPPVRTIHQHKRQVQPGAPRPLERKVTEPDQDASQSQPSQNRKLERAPTEPALTPTAPVRMRGFLNLDEFDPIHRQDIVNSQSPDVNTEIPRNLQTDASTGFVTVESSRSRSVQSMDDSQATTLPPQSSLVVSSSRSSALRRMITRSQPTTLRSNPSRDFTGPSTPRVTATRYHLRKRPAPTIPPSPPKPVKRARKNSPREATTQSSRRHPISAQSSHSPIKSKDSATSPSSRTLRQHAVTNGKGKRKRS